MAFNPKSDYAGKSSTPGKAGGYSGGGSYGGGQGLAAVRDSPARILGGAMPSGLSAKDFYGALRGPGPQQMGMPTNTGPGGIMGRILPSGDSLGAGFGAMMPSPMRIGAAIGESIMGPAVARRMREQPQYVANVGGKPMSLDGRVMGDGYARGPMAFSGLYGNKDPQALTAQGFMRSYDKGRYAPWQGDIPFFRERNPNGLAISGGLY